MLRFALIPLIACSVASVPSPAWAQMQPGSAGGTIGKQGRSASGVEAGESGKPESQRERPNARDTGSGPLTAAALRGRWTGSLNCPDGQMRLVLDIRETSATSFGGDYGDEGGKIVSGQFSRGSISFVTQAIISRTWTGSVLRSGTGLRMQGSHKADWGANSLGAGNCRFSATKG